MVGRNWAVNDAQQMPRIRLLRRIQIEIGLAISSLIFSQTKPRLPRCRTVGPSPSSFFHSLQSSLRSISGRVPLSRIGDSSSLRDPLSEMGETDRGRQRNALNVVRRVTVSRSAIGQVEKPRNGPGSARSADRGSDLASACPRVSQIRALWPG